MGTSSARASSLRPSPHSAPSPSSSSPRLLARTDSCHQQQQLRFLSCIYLFAYGLSRTEPYSPLQSFLGLPLCPMLTAPSQGRITAVRAQPASLGGHSPCLPRASSHLPAISVPQVPALPTVGCQPRPDPWLRSSLVLSLSPQHTPRFLQLLMTHCNTVCWSFSMVWSFSMLAAGPFPAVSILIRSVKQSHCTSLFFRCSWPFVLPAN